MLGRCTQFLRCGQSPQTARDGAYGSFYACYSYSDSDPDSDPGVLCDSADSELELNPSSSKKMGWRLRLCTIVRRFLVAHREKMIIVL